MLTASADNLSSSQMALSSSRLSLLRVLLRFSFPPMVVQAGATPSTLHRSFIARILGAFVLGHFLQPQLMVRARCTYSGQTVDSSPIVLPMISYLRPSLAALLPPL